MDRTALAKRFPGQALPLELEKLLDFDQRGDGYYSDGFELTDLPPDALGSWSDEEEFLEHLVPFAQATGGGSIYALWLARDGMAVSAAPVVVFGDEGGVHVVAEHLRALLHLLGFDAEPMIDWDGVTFYRPADQEASPRAGEYAAWLEAELGLASPPDADALVTAAQAAHGAAFDAWVKRFLK